MTASNLATQYRHISMPMTLRKCGNSSRSGTASKHEHHHQHWLTSCHGHWTWIVLCPIHTPETTWQTYLWPSNIQNTGCGPRCTQDWNSAHNLTQWPSTRCKWHQGQRPQEMACQQRNSTGPLESHNPTCTTCIPNQNHPNMGEIYHLGYDTKTRGGCLMMTATPWQCPRTSPKLVWVGLVVLLSDMAGASQWAMGPFYKATIQAILLHGTETWMLTQPLLHMLYSCHHHCACYLACMANTQLHL